MKLLGLFLLFPLSAMAHVEDGLYQGTTDKGAVCEMTSNKTYFEGTFKHPLNERVELVVNGVTFIVQHPAIIDETKPSAGFDHDQFKGVVPTKTGAQALVVKMAHTEKSEGPTEYYLITHTYKGNIAEVLKCSGLLKK